MTGLQHINLEPMRIAEKGDPGWHVQTRGEDRDLEARWDHNVLAGARIEQRRVIRTEGIRHRRREHRGWQCEAGRKREHGA